MVAASMGYAARLSVAAAGTLIASYSESHEFVSESLKKTGTIQDTSGIRGTRSHHSGRTRAGTYTVGGTIMMHASPAMLDLWLPRILGANEATDVFALAETLPEFDVLIDRVAKRFVYGGCKVNRATFRGRAGQLIELELDIVGKTETVSATSFPSITAPTDPPYIFTDDVAVTLVSGSRTITEFDVVIDNALVSRFSNSQSATDISPSDRIVSLRTSHPFTSDEVDLYGQSNGGAAASLVLTNGGYSTTFSVAAWQVPDSSPVIGQKTAEIVLGTEGVCRMSGSTRELVVTHDAAA